MTRCFVSAKRTIRYFSNSSKLVEHRAQSSVHEVHKNFNSSQVFDNLFMHRLFKHLFTILYNGHFFSQTHCVHSKTEINVGWTHFLVLTDHNEDLSCQTEYNPHSFLLQSTGRYFKAKINTGIHCTFSTVL